VGYGVPTHKQSLQSVHLSGLASSAPGSWGFFWPVACWSFLWHRRGRMVEVVVEAVVVVIVCCLLVGTVKCG
jgi:hypothetical protein